MQQILPNSFVELIAGTLMFAALFIAVISLMQKERKASTKVAAILFVASLCLFSGNGWIYFAGVSIVAIAVTELDFLNNIAALIYGTKECFENKTVSQRKS